MNERSQSCLKCPECGCEATSILREPGSDEPTITDRGFVLVQCQLCDFIFSANAETALAETRVEEHGLSIDTDRPCAGCGYNLRTLAVGGQCPECGTVIEARRPRSTLTPEDEASARGMPLWFHFSMIATMCVAFYFRKAPIGAAAIFAAMAAQAGAEGVIVVMRRRVRIGGSLIGKTYAGIRAVLHGVAAIVFAMLLLALSGLLWFGWITPAQIGL